MQYPLPMQNALQEILPRARSGCLVVLSRGLLDHDEGVDIDTLL